MKIKDIISEGGMKKIRTNHKQAISNLTTYPDLNMSTGSAYMNYRFGVALAGAPENEMNADNFIGGDPVTVTFSKEEQDMIAHAAKQVGVNIKQNWSGTGSEESRKINTQSIVSKPKKNKYGV
jgi:hypothetical protein